MWFNPSAQQASGHMAVMDEQSFKNAGLVGQKAPQIPIHLNYDQNGLLKATELVNNQEYQIQMAKRALAQKNIIVPEFSTSMGSLVDNYE